MELERKQIPTCVSMSYEQRFYSGWWDLQLCSTLHSMFSYALWPQGVFFPFSTLPICNGHSFCLLCSWGKKLLFSSPAFLFPRCHWIFDVRMYIGRLGSLLLCYVTWMSYSVKHHQPINCLPNHLAHWNFSVRFTQAYAQIAAFY